MTRTLLLIIFLPSLLAGCGKANVDVATPCNQVESLLSEADLFRHKAYTTLKQVQALHGLWTKMANKQALSDEEKILASPYSQPGEILWHMRGLKEAMFVSCDATSNFRSKARWTLSDLGNRLRETDPDKARAMDSLAAKLVADKEGSCTKQFLNRFDFVFKPEDVDQTKEWVDGLQQEERAIRESCQ
jgi:hypothetical protein